MLKSDALGPTSGRLSITGSDRLLLAVHFSDDETADLLFAGCWRLLDIFFLRLGRVFASTREPDGYDCAHGCHAYR
jgi:hypothetical protein